MQKSGLSTLLDLHQSLIDQEDGYWIKIEAWEVATSQICPHGIRYSLTLHNPKGLRILGYDNVHAVKTSSRYSGRKLPYDHRHRNAEDVGIRYEFKDAYQLLSDFFEDADRVLRRAKER